jgi:SAM-dependent methyltransferase
MNRGTSSDWATLDRAADADAFVGYLDAAHGHHAIRAYKEKSFGLLHLQPGDCVLDVGCGAGDDARALARIVAPDGLVVAVDASVRMIEEARRRSEGLELLVDYRVGNIQDLDLGDGAFDSARADRVFQHLDDPVRALDELKRVTRPGGRVVVAEPDWGTLVVDSCDAATTQAVLTAITGGIRNPWMGRRLFGLFRRAGFTEVEVVAGTAVLTNFAEADRLLRFSEGANRAQACGAVTAEAAAHWRRSLESAAAAGEFCCAITGFAASGRRA